MFGRKKRDRWEDDGFPEEEFLTDGTGIYNPITEEDAERLTEEMKRLG